MSATLSAGAGRLTRSSSLTLLLAAFAAALYALTAYQYGPLSMPAVLCGVGAVVVTFSRPEIGIAVALILIPLGNLGYLRAGEIEPPTWLPVAGWAIFLTALTISRWGRTSADSRFTLPLIGYFLTLCVSAAIAGQPSVALSTIRATAVGLLLFFAIVTFVPKPRQLAWVLIGVAVTGAIAGLVAIREFNGGGSSDIAFLTTSGEIVGRAAGGFGHPNSLGGFMVLAVPLIGAGALAFQRLRWLFLPALVLSMAGLYVSFSRASLVGVAIGALFFLNRRRLLVAVPVVAVVLVASGAPALLAERFETLNTTGSDLSSRQDFWRVAVNVWQEHPLVGSGPGTFPDQYAEARISGKQFLPNSVFQPPPHAHNVFLNQLAEVGLLGFTALLVILVLFARSAYRLWRAPEPWMRAMGSGMLAALTGWVIHNMFDVTLVESPGTFFFVVLGILSATVGMLEADGRLKSARPRRAAGSELDLKPT